MPWLKARALGSTRSSRSPASRARARRACTYVKRTRSDREDKLIPDLHVTPYAASSAHHDDEN